MKTTSESGADVMQEKPQLPSTGFNENPRRNETDPRVHANQYTHKVEQKWTRPGEIVRKSGRCGPVFLRKLCEKSRNAIKHTLTTERVMFGSDCSNEEQIQFVWIPFAFCPTSGFINWPLVSFLDDRGVWYTHLKTQCQNVFFATLISAALEERDCSDAFMMILKNTAHSPNNLK
ncbi:hypothetical protein ABVT39_012519, partial [Epinephelus coioides]